MMIKLAAGNQQPDIKSINTKMPACGNSRSPPTLDGHPPLLATFKWQYVRTAETVMTVYRFTVNYIA